jgi:hypothetical protein
MKTQSLWAASWQLQVLQLLLAALACVKTQSSSRGQLAEQHPAVVG